MKTTKNNTPKVGQRVNFLTGLFEIVAVSEWYVSINIIQRDADGVSRHSREEFTTLQNFALNYFGYKSN